MIVVVVVVGRWRARAAAWSVGKIRLAAADTAVVVVAVIAAAAAAAAEPLTVPVLLSLM